MSQANYLCISLLSNISQIQQLQNCTKANCISVQSLCLPVPFRASIHPSHQLSLISVQWIPKPTSSSIHLNHPSLLRRRNKLLSVSPASRLTHCSLSTYQPWRMILKWKFHYFTFLIPSQSSSVKPDKISCTY